MELPLSPLARRLCAVLVAGPAALAQCPSWSTSLGSLPEGQVARDIVRFDVGLGAGPELFLAHSNSSQLSAQVGGVRRWNGSSWVETMPSADNSVVALAIFDEGVGAKLYAATEAGVMRLDGTMWTPLGPANMRILALEVIDLGSGPRLHAAGTRTIFGYVPSVVRLDNGAWTDMTQNLSIGNSQAQALAVFDDGTGPGLYLGGRLNILGTDDLMGLCRLGPAGWTPVPMAFAATQDATVRSLLTLDLGQGPALFGAITYDPPGSMSLAAAVGRYDGSSWTLIGSPLPAGLLPSGTAFALAAFDDRATGKPALFVSGTFDHVSGQSVDNVARWDGTSWSALTGGPGASSQSLIGLSAFEDGASRPRLLVGGTIRDASGVVSSLVWTWDGCPIPGTTTCAGDGSATACPCGPGGAGRGCPHSVSPQGALLRAQGIASLAGDTLVLLGSEMPSGTALYFQGTTSDAGGMGVVFGDGLSCAGGTTARLGVKSNSAGSSSYPALGDRPISVQGSVGAPGPRTYQTWFRNAAAFCAPATFNLTNGLVVTWGA